MDKQKWKKIAQNFLLEGYNMYIVESRQLHMANIKW